MRSFKIEVEVLDYKRGFVCAVRTFDVVSESADRAQELVEGRFDMDYVESVSVEEGVQAAEQVESCVELPERAVPRDSGA